MNLEQCFKSDCSYELDVNSFLAGQGLSDGLCPLCGGSAVFECPSCRRLNVTKWRIRALNRCRSCETKFDPCDGCRKDLLTCSNSARDAEDTAAEFRQKVLQKASAKRALMIARTRLSPREVEVLELTVQGFSTKEIAERLGI